VRRIHSRQSSMRGCCHVLVRTLYNSN
jgi:hypothetical protein